MVSNDKDLKDITLKDGWLKINHLLPTTTKNAGVEFHNLFGGLFRNTIKSFRNTHSL